MHLDVALERGDKITGVIKVDLAPKQFAKIERPVEQVDRGV